jgi:hypothetical protein
MKTFSEFVCPDGYVSTKVPLNAIKFIDIDALRASIYTGPEVERYAHYCDLIGNGHAANGVPVVYRTPKGNLFASDVRYSDIALFARQNIKFHPAIDQHVADPYVSVKIIEIAGRDDIPAQRAAYLEAQK